MDNEFKPASYRKRKFQNIHDLLHSKTFTDPINPGRSGETAVVSIPDMNQQDAPHDDRDTVRAAIRGESWVGQGMPMAEQTDHRASPVGLPVADLDQVPDHWLTEQEEPGGQRYRVEGCVTDLCRSFEDIDPLVSQFSNRGHDEETSVLVFASTDAYANSASLANSVAVSLAGRLQRPVILIDSDFKHRRLTRLFGLQEDRGIGNYLFQGDRSSHGLYRTDRDQVIFVPTGVGPFGPWENASLNTRRWLEMLDRQFLFVCVHVGDAHGQSLPLWSPVCRDAFLSVNRKRSSQAIARSAVSRMRGLGMKLHGCVVHSS